MGTWLEWPSLRAHRPSKGLDWSNSTQGFIIYIHDKNPHISATDNCRTFPATVYDHSAKQWWGNVIHVFNTDTETHSVRAYWVIWPQSLGRWSSIFRVKHVEQTNLVGMFLTLRERKTERAKACQTVSGVLFHQVSQVGKKSMTVTPPWQLPQSFYLCSSWRC